MWRVTDRLKTRDDEGTVHIVVVMRNGTALDYVMADGRAVTRLGDGSFRIDETGKALRLET